MAIANQTKTIVGVFNSVLDANAAVRDLEAEGISRNDISIVANKNATGYENLEERDKASDVVADAGIGAAIGGVGGLLLSAAGAITIPVIGPVLAAGPIAAALTGAGIGAAAGGLIGALTESGIPEEDARYYAEGVRRGDVLVTVKASDTQADIVTRTLDRHNAIDVEDRVTSWKSRGWSGWSDSAKPYNPQELHSEREYYRPATGGTSSGYAGQPSGHVTGSDLSNSGFAPTAAGNASYIDDTMNPPTTSTDPRDRDRDGWVADDKAREMASDAKKGAKRAGQKMGDAMDRAKESVKGAFSSDEAAREAERRRRARVYDRTLL